MIRYPLLLGFRDLVAGNGFIADVVVAGRALLVDEGGGFWMYGVNPGGIAAGGASVGEAQAEFRSAYRSVLFDIASEAQTFDELRRQVEHFFSETNEPTREEWEEAVVAVRQGRVDADWLSRKSAESRIGVQVTLMEHPEPSINVLDEAELAA